MSMQLTKEEKTIADQRVRIEELQEKVRLLEEETQPAPPPDFPREWRLTAQQSRVLMILYKSQGTVKRDYLLRALESQSQEADNVLKVVMVRLRKKLRPVGVEIHNQWNVGYWIDEEARAIIKAACPDPAPVQDPVTS